MRVKSEILLLRPPVSADIDIIFHWENDPNHWLVSNTYAPYTRDQITAFVENRLDLYVDQQMRLMIEDMAGNAVGCLDLYDFDPINKRVGIGILIDANYRGKGYGAETLKILVKYSFEVLEINSLYAEVLEDNLTSRKLFEGAGFELVGVLKDWVWDGQVFLSKRLYQRFAS